MDEDLIAFGIVMLLFLSFPFLTVLSITGCVAYSRTKAWDKARNQRAVSLESSETNPLVTEADDEEEHNQRQADEEADKHLTFGQKFRKEFKSVWMGKGKTDVLKQKEREERRKLAKAVARELDRRERRKARAAAKKEDGSNDFLPAYTKA